MKLYFSLLIVILTNTLFAQVKGTVTDEKGNPLAFVNIFEENTYNGTTTNENGEYILSGLSKGSHKIIFQYLGYKTQKKIVEISNSVNIQNITMTEESFTLNEIVINTSENPANKIIRNAIRNKKDNSDKTSNYKADFYSKGIFRIKDAPKSLLGKKFNQFDEILDSTRSGILYLSETVSKIKFQKPDKLKEEIIASKVSGKDNGFSFNNAASVNFDFYENYIPFEVNIVSPIADNAFNYYKYKFEGSFFTENNQQINKIKVISRRDSEPSFDGYIYIEDDNYSIYAVDLTIIGSKIQSPAINTLTLKQSFSYNSKNRIWVKNTQTIDFTAGIFGINISGRFTYVYNNYEFDNIFNRKTFNREVLSFQLNANKKTDEYWNEIRPVPLTKEETTDYIKKDLLQTKKKSKSYLDSIDAKKNKFHFTNLISRYTYRNSFEKWTFNYTGPLLSPSFNTIQGWNFNADLSFTKRHEEERTFTRISSKIDYGISEDRLRANITVRHKFNNINNSTIIIQGGSSINQFNSSNPITENINAISSLFFKDNYMKLYEKNFASVRYSRELFNGLNLNVFTEYANRKPLFNTSNQSFFKSSDQYTSNNPILPNDFLTPTFENHNLLKTGITARIKFGQQYWSRPDGKFNIGNNKYPTIIIGAEKAFSANEKNYEYELIHTRIFHDITLGNKGILQMNLKGGKFFNAENISFVDYKHFNGNQTHIGQSNSYTNVFNLLPYYSSSTNNRYFELHLEHNDKGYLMNKLPLINKIQSQLVLGYHNLSLPERLPYQEYSLGLDNLGFGKFRLLRLDYVRSYSGKNYSGDGIIFGLKFLNLID